MKIIKIMPILITIPKVIGDQAMFEAPAIEKLSALKYQHQVVKLSAHLKMGGDGLRKLFVKKLNQVKLFSTLTNQKLLEKFI